MDAPACGRPGRRARFGAAALSTAAHVSILVLLLQGRPAPRAADPPTILVTLAEVRLAPPAPPAAAEDAAAKPAPPQPDHADSPKPVTLHQAAARAVRRAPEDPDADEDGGQAGPGASLSGAQLAGAASADSAPGGGACDMARRVQSALRKDPLVQAAVAHAGAEPAGAILVWDGDWVQDAREDGKGLAAVREALTWEIAFAPAACRAQPMRGLLLLSMNGGPGATRLALGQGDWRWSDLLR